MTAHTANNKRLAKNTLLLYLRMLLTMGISLYTSRIVLATLGAVDYGIYNVVGGFVTMFAIVSGAMTTATQRFLSFEIGKELEGNMRSLFSTAVMIHIVLAGVILILAETVGVWFINTQMNFPADRYTAVNWVFQFSVLTFIISVISVPYNAAIVAHEKMAVFAYISIVEVTLKLIVVYLLAISTFDKLLLYAALLAVIAIVVRIIYGVYCNKHLTDCRCNWKWDAKYRSQIMSFVSWNLIGSAAGIAKEQGLNVMLNIFYGVAVNAARGIAYQVLGALQGFVANFQLALNPQIVKLYAAGDKQEMFKLVYRGSKFSYILLFSLSLPVIIEAPYVLQLWLMQVPEYTAIFLRLVLITALIDSLSGPLIASMHASGRVRNYQIVVGGISLLTLPIAYLFFKLGYPPYIAMMISLAISVCCHFVRLILLNYTIQLPIRSFLCKVTFKAFLISFLSLIMPLFLYYNMESSFLSFFLICIVAITSSLFVSFFIGLDRKEREFMLNKAGTLVNRIRR